MNSKALLVLLGLAVAGIAPAAATITIVNNDAAGVGFNDPTVVAPVGGNTGTTLGQQRLNVFQAAASIWGATLTSVPAVNVRAQWAALTCTSTGAVLGSAGALQVFRDFPGAVPGYWYGEALTNKLFGSNADPATPEINATFNVNLGGNPNCLPGTFFYLGLDNNHGTNVDLLAVLLHELGHGLGFQTFTSGSTGAFTAGFPSIYDRFLLDTTISKTWDTMTASERVASAINDQKLIWTGANVTGSTSTVLSNAARAIVTAPASVASSYLAQAASFGPVITLAGVTGEVMPVVDQANGTGLACTALSAVNAAAVNGKVALIDRGTCGFAVKVKNAQNAGAIGVLIANNAAGLPTMGGADATVTIPSLGILQSDGNLLKVALRTRSRTRSGMFVSLKLDTTALAGADSLGRMRMFAPSPFQSGSSVSHFDVTAFRNLLMEPSINGDLTSSVTVPQDLTFQLLKDLGWN